MAGSMDWVVQLTVDRATARAVLSQDRVANVYALSDLEPPYDRYTTVAVASRNGSAEAACLVVRHPAFTGIVTHGHVADLQTVLATIRLPQMTHLDIPIVHRALIDHHCSFTDAHERQLMAVTASTFRAVPQLPNIVRLGNADLNDLVDLYAGYQASAFHPAQLEHGVFFGAREEGRLVAAAGTPGLALQAGIAIVTSVFTRLEARRHGFGAMVTSAVTRALFALGCRDVCLDVEADNTVAQRLYERLGYQLHSTRWQGEAVLHERPAR